MIKKITAVLCLLAFLGAVGGCQLAKEESGAANADRLIGVVITTKHLDLFDYDAYMKDNAEKIISGSIEESDTQKYGGRLYATETLVKNENGEEHPDYVFEGVSGIRFFEVQIPGTETADPYFTLIGDEGIIDTKTCINAGDKEGITLEGTVYISPAIAGDAFFLNPVYQDDEGNVYVTTGTGCSGSAENPVGTAFTQYFKASSTTTENGKQTSYEMSVTVSFTYKNAAEKLKLLQMDEAHSIITGGEFAPGDMPESFTPENNTAYIVMESYGMDKDGNLLVTRELYGKDAEYFRTFHEREDGICAGKDTQLNWP